MKHLQIARPKEQKIFLNYLQNLILIIPTALKIAHEQNNLIQYVIRKSSPVLDQIKDYSKP